MEAVSAEEGFERMSLEEAEEAIEGEPSPIAEPAEMSLEEAREILGRE